MVSDELERMGKEAALAYLKMYKQWSYETEEFRKYLAHDYNPEKESRTRDPSVYSWEPIASATTFDSLVRVLFLQPAHV
jgi:hypothetical protein